MKIFAKAFYPFALAVLFFLFCGSPSFAVDIATVNGEGISLRELEARRTQLFSGPSSSSYIVEDEELRQQYLYVLQHMVEEIVICQYMQSKGLGVEPVEIEVEENLIRNDYPAGAFEQMLLEEGINLDMWREWLRRSLLVRKYIDVYIKPDVVPTPDEMLEYYTSHSDEFIIPEQWRFIQITGDDKSEVSAARDLFLQSRNATDAQKKYMVTIHEVQAATETLPPGFAKKLEALSPWSKSDVTVYESGFNTLVLLEKISQTKRDAAAVTTILERILIEDKLSNKYRHAVDKLISKAKIRYASALLNEYTRGISAEPSSSEKSETGEADSDPQ